MSKHELSQQWFQLEERERDTKSNKNQLVSEGEIWWTAVSENVSFG